MFLRVWFKQSLLHLQVIGTSFYHIYGAGATNITPLTLSSSSSTEAHSGLWCLRICPHRGLGRTLPSLGSSWPPPPHSPCCGQLNDFLLVVILPIIRQLLISTGEEGQHFLLLLRWKKLNKLIDDADNRILPRSDRWLHRHGSIFVFISCFSSSHTCNIELCATLHYVHHCITCNIALCATYMPHCISWVNFQTLD